MTLYITYLCTHIYQHTKFCSFAFHPKKDTVASPQTPYMLMCIAPLILKIQSNNGYVEMLHANAFLATLTVFAFIKACS